MTGVDDLVADGNVVYKIITAAAVSTDANYNNLNPDDVTGEHLSYAMSRNTQRASMREYDKR